MYLHKEDTIALLNSSFDGLTTFLQQLSDHRFTVSPSGKWSAGQHLDHLIKSQRPLYTALTAPRLLLRWFGKPRRASLTYEELVHKYRLILASGATTPKMFSPSVIYAPQRSAQMQTWLLQQQKLAERTAAWPESDLDRYQLPHPLLGKITIREMLYLTAYHIQHHQELLSQQEKQQHRWEYQLEQALF